MIKKIFIILFSVSFLISNNNIKKVNKNHHSQLFKQAQSLEKNGLFNESKLIYETILSKDPGNKIAFNKIKIILKNENNFILLKEIAQNYYENRINDPMSKIALFEVYLLSSDKKWEKLSNEIFNENLETDFIIKVLLNKLLESNMIDYANNLIESKREGKKKQDFYSLEIGNYYISRLNYESAIIEFLLYLDYNPNEYDRISNKIISIPDYIEIQKKIKSILKDSSSPSSKILLSDLAFKSEDFNHSYELLKANFQTPNQLLDFAYQNKKIYNYDLAIEVYKYIIEEEYNNKITISAILEMADAFEKKSMRFKKIALPISQFFYDNEILNSPYQYIDAKNLQILNEAISLYDSLYITSKGSNAGFRLAEIKFSILNDLDKSLDIYDDCIKYSRNSSIKLKSILRKIDIMIAKGDLVKARKILIESRKKYKNLGENDIWSIKNIQLDFLTMQPSVADSISNIIVKISKDNPLYNDLLEIQSILYSFKNNPDLLTQFSKIQFLIFQNKRMQAISELVDIHSSSTSNKLIKDFIIYQLSYLLLLTDNSNGALNYLEGISHNTIFSEFSYILKAEIFDFILGDKKNAVDLYLDFLKKYPLSIFYDDIRFRLREIAN